MKYLYPVNHQGRPISRIFGPYRPRHGWDVWRVLPRGEPMMIDSILLMLGEDRRPWSTAFLDKGNERHEIHRLRDLGFFKISNHHRGWTPGEILNNLRPYIEENKPDGAMYCCILKIPDGMITSRLITMNKYASQPVPLP
jgi:hypothetical protein